ncbi:hypothetical protein BC938DRAFT_471278 [Jimgerdemannia flammicorona]|uniref:Uncharacterized protein n=1 Tax=Jimgerdemannia flammicorona TaxID=994334 RepID=A0A433Q8G3_9FUNG|nr:hypothetical protein BC938DRAFT_471278 [Jimgerdemannia flammicorona]
MDKIMNLFGKKGDASHDNTGDNRDHGRRPQTDLHTQSHTSPTSLEQVHRAEERERQERMHNEGQQERAQENARKISEIVEQSVEEGGISQK